ncbi:hypothetical protein PV797_16685 [Clostridiaceae bacterium M8S5]|nr:hypothetical protein PV797_16685 [Clostridiaceae bacterium M8S5]
MISAKALLNYDLDTIPKYLLMRDIIKLSKDDKILLKAKQALLESKHIKNITSLQWDDGSWGQFHSMSQFSSSKITTEQAIRRLLTVGLDINDEPIKKVLGYMNSYMLGEIVLRDYNEKKHDWGLLTKLFVATWMVRIDTSNELAINMAEKWAQIITHAFSEDTYDYKAYLEAYNEVLKPEPKKSIWGFQNFYVVSLLAGYLDSDIRSKFLDYIMNEDKGIYYIYSNNLKTPPKDFCSREANRYIRAYELLSRYEGCKDKFVEFTNWINKNVSEDGFWDMGKIARDKMNFPLSESWRKSINRKIDCTVRIIRILDKIK